MKKKTIMIDMDEVIVRGRFSEFIDEFLIGADFKQLNSFYRQDLIKGREEEFRERYQYRNLYKNDDGSFIEPLPNCVEVIRRLNELYDVYIVTSYVWKESVIDTASNLKNKHEYLKYFFPFMNENNFIYIADKSKIAFDIGIDDRPNNLVSCGTRLLFTEFRNEHLTDEELARSNITRANDWLEIDRMLNENELGQMGQKVIG